MSVSFDWEFAEEKDARRSRGDGTPPSQRRRWLLWGIVLAVVLMLFIVGRAFVARRLRLAEMSEAEFRSAVELEIKAISTNDQELFATLQDPADPTWQERQLARFVQREQAFVPAPGLCPAERPAAILDIHYFGKTGRAEISHWFKRCSERVAVETGWQADAVPFHTTWFFARDESGNWHHTAPPADYWGIPYSWHGNRLTVRATEIEAGRIDPSARGLAILVSQACLWMECPEADRYTISFEDIVAPEVREGAWILPALYLTGLPATENSLDVWEDVLARWTVEKLIVSQVGDTNLARRIVYQQLAAGLLTRLGLEGNPDVSPFPIDVELLARALREKTQHPFWSLWYAIDVANDPDKTEIYETEVAALLQFLEGEVGPNRVYALLPALGHYRRLGDALTSVYGLDEVEINHEWLRFLQQLTGVPLMPALFAVPSGGGGRQGAPPGVELRSLSAGVAFVANCTGHVSTDRVGQESVVSEGLCSGPIPNAADDDGDAGRLGDMSK